jgi:hypothetical protein
VSRARLRQPDLERLTILDVKGLRDHAPAAAELYQSQVVSEEAWRNGAMHLGEGGGRAGVIDADDPIMPWQTLRACRRPALDQFEPLRSAEVVQLAVADAEEMAFLMKDLATSPSCSPSK